MWEDHDCWKVSNHLLTMQLLQHNRCRHMPVHMSNMLHIHKNRILLLQHFKVQRSRQLERLLFPSVHPHKGFRRASVGPGVISTLVWVNTHFNSNPACFKRVDRSVWWPDEMYVLVKRDTTCADVKEERCLLFNSFHEWMNWPLGSHEGVLDYRPL